MKRDNKQLTPHFSLYEMTATLNADLQERNRDLSDEQVGKLLNMARFMEFIRLIIGRPLIVHSGYRCMELNGATPGSSTTSQHPLCEACDFNAEDLTPEQCYNLLCYEAPFLQFGQLIWEKRGDKEWVHISVKGSRPPEKCGQIFKITTQ